MPPWWLNQSYPDALRLVAERALYQRTFPKIAASLPYWSGIVGGLGSTLASDDPEDNWQQQRALWSQIGEVLDKATQPQRPTSQNLQQALKKLQDARTTLGLLGADPEAVEKGPQAEKEILRSIPGIKSQLANVLQAASLAQRHGYPLEALNQLDVVGLKNLNPLSSHFDLPILSLTAGLPILVRKWTPLLQKWLEGKGSVAGALSKFFLSPYAKRTILRKGLGRIMERGARKFLGNNLGLVAALAPVLLHEWFQGYRTGRPAVKQMQEAQKTVRQERPSLR
jgi:hypothetical protein